MKLVIQRVKNASVEVDNKIVGEIDQGFLVLVGIKVGDTKQQVDYLVKKGFSQKYGARNLRRLIQTDIEDEIATYIINSFGAPITAIAVDTDESEKIKVSAI